MPTKRVKIGSHELKLDARPDRLDLRDRPYQPPLGCLPAQWPDDSDVARLLPAYAEAHQVLDQGQEGACTGFGLAAVINYLRFIRATEAGLNPPAHVSPAMLYQLAQLYDEWPGEDYEGSSCRGALRGWQRHGVCCETLWPYPSHVENDQGQRMWRGPKEDAKNPDDPESNWDLDALTCTLGVYYRIDVRSVVDMQAAIRQNGAIYVSGTVHEGWGVASRSTLRSHADLVRIKAVPRPKEPGGHAFALVGYNAEGFVVQNSWGPGWGSMGFALLPYEDWVSHGSDAWVFTLGVPSSSRIRSPRFLVPANSVRSASVSLHEAARNERPAGLVGADDALTRRYRDLPAKWQPLSGDDAYRHAVLLDRGLPIRNDITAENAANALDTAVLQRPRDWLRAQDSVKVLVYAHGGLNSEADAITRVRVLAPYCLANGIYPLFVVWRSGALETVSNLVEEWGDRLGIGSAGTAPTRGWLDHLTEVSDRMLEPVLRGPGGALWGDMKRNAERASNDGSGGVRLMVERLKTLNKELNNKLEIHLIGHSAGSIVLGSMLARLQEAGLKASSLRLFAPACTVRFALDHYMPAVEKEVVNPRHFNLHVLSDENEKNDCVGPYRKSLLYLVSRSLEDVHKMPLLGLARAFDPATASDDNWSAAHVGEVQKWQSFWQKLGQPLDVLKTHSVSNGAGNQPARHGCFDNATNLMSLALGAIVNPDAPAKVIIRRLDY